jgi:hypothetical protein
LLDAPARPFCSQRFRISHSFAAGLAGFDMPLVYVFKDKLNQPIFGCNNLAGQQQQQHMLQGTVCMHVASHALAALGGCKGESCSRVQSMPAEQLAVAANAVERHKLQKTTPHYQAHTANVADASGGACASFDLCVCCCLCVVCAGQVWPAVNGGGPSGTLPPHSFKVLFKEVSLSSICP